MDYADQLLASGLGGYLAGRLRTKWVAAHADEVYFRDSAHGFLAWAVATLATATLLTSVIGGIVSGGVKAGATLVGGAANTAITAAAGGAAMAGSSKSHNDDEGVGYFVDSLFRKDGAAIDRANQSSKGGNLLSSGEQGSAASMSEIAFFASLSAIYGGRQRDL